MKLEGLHHITMITERTLRPIVNPRAARREAAEGVR
jgi:hypothetical protein